jgi:hypothetical protein
MASGVLAPVIVVRRLAAHPATPRTKAVSSQKPAITTASPDALSTPATAASAPNATAPPKAVTIADTISKRHFTLYIFFRHHDR